MVFFCVSEGTARESSSMSYLKFQAVEVLGDVADVMEDDIAKLLAGINQLQLIFHSALTSFIFEHDGLKFRELCDHVQNPNEELILQ